MYLLEACPAASIANTTPCFWVTLRRNVCRRAWALSRIRSSAVSRAFACAASCFRSRSTCCRSSRALAGSKQGTGACRARAGHGRVAEGEPLQPGRSVQVPVDVVPVADRPEVERGNPRHPAKLVVFREIEWAEGQGRESEATRSGHEFNSGNAK